MSKLAFKSFVDFPLTFVTSLNGPISGSFSDEIPQVGGVMSQPD